MRLREANPSDISSMGTIQAEANRTDSIVQWALHDIDKYPMEYWISSTRFAKRRMAQIGFVSFVVETEASDYPPEQRSTFKVPEVVGFAIWNRIGKSEKAEEWQKKYNWGWFAALDRMLYSLEDRYWKQFPLPITDVAKRAQFHSLLAGQGSFDPEIFAEAWDLDVFYVHPDWQRRGLGRKMMEWGFDRAREERVPVILKGSARGGLAYRRYGFETIGEVGLNRWFDTLRFGGVEPALYCWEPEGWEGVWVERAREKWEAQRGEWEAKQQ